MMGDIIAQGGGQQKNGGKGVVVAKGVRWNSGYGVGEFQAPVARGFARELCFCSSGRCVGVAVGAVCCIMLVSLVSRYSS